MNYDLASDDVSMALHGPKLSLRERQVLEHLLEGRTNKEIGRNLNISPRTVEKHRYRLKEKLGATNLADIIRIGLDLCPRAGGAGSRASSKVTCPGAKVQASLTRVLVTYVSRNGYVHQMAESVGIGARSVGDTEVTLRQIPCFRNDLGKLRLARPQHQLLDVHTLFDYDVILFGTPNRYGNMAQELHELLERAMASSFRNALFGKVGGAFGSVVASHGDSDSVLRSLHTILLSLGMLPIGIPLAATAKFTASAPYGAIGVIDHDMSRPITRNELAAAYWQGRHAARVGRVFRQAGIPVAPRNQPATSHGDHMP